MYADKYVSDKKSMPEDGHWAIVKYSNVHIPGDQRSKDCPGHGYPAHSESIVKYEAYFTKEKWLAAIKELESGRYRADNYTALEVRPVKIKKEISVEVT